MNTENLFRTELMSGAEISHTIQRIAFEILERHHDRPLAFVGIQTRGVVVAERVFQALSDKKADIERGTLDITLYRDDLDNLGTIPAVKSSDIDFDVNGRTVVLFDDVLFTGRTIRAAIDALMDFGRPSKIELAVLVDRGNRELPIAPDCTGRFIKTKAGEYISVRFQETDGEDGVYLLSEERRS